MRAGVSHRGLAASAVLTLVGVLLAPASANAVPAANSSPRATVADQVDLTFPLQTRVATAQPIEPGDHLAVTVGTVTHKAPAAGQWICPTGVWVLRLVRATLAEDGSASAPMCTSADATRLGDMLHNDIPTSDMVIVNSLNRAPGGESRTLPKLGAALAEIGAPADEFGAVNLADTGFSVEGIPGLTSGQAYTGIESLSSEAKVPGGSPTAASVSGLLTRDNHGNFAITMQDYALYDIGADGAITLDGHGYPVPAEPAGFKGGFHLLVVDRRTLAPISDTLYATNDNPAEQYRMGTDLARLATDRGQSVMIFLATVGNPVGGRQLPAGPVNLGAHCGGSAAFTVTCAYTPTAPSDGGSEQTFTVPGPVAGYPVTALHVTLQGGYGGYAKSGGEGGNPDRVTGDLPVGASQAIKPHQALYVEVAGEGTSGGDFPGGLGGWNGGAGGGSSHHGRTYGWPGGGGGGASDIRTVSRANGNTAASSASRLVVAAGGGGAGGDSHDAGRGGDGGNAGGSGGDGLPGSYGGGAGGGGGAAIGADGGAGGAGIHRGGPGTLATGGSGNATDGTDGASGGGAGGYYGGGGGGTATGGGGGGGGGSDLVPAGGTAQLVTRHEVASVAISYSVPYGTLAQALRPFGATPSVVADLSRSPRYALVGTLNTPAAAARHLSPDSPEASPQIRAGATGDLQGVLQPGHQNMWYGSVASNAPVVRSINGQPQPPTVVNYGLYDVVSHVSAPWPVPVAGAHYVPQQKALAYLSQRACGCADIRAEYNATSNIIQAWQQTITAAAFVAGQGFGEADFTAVKKQLITELGDVNVVDGLKEGMHTLLSDQQQMLQPALQAAYHDVRNSLDVNGDATTNSIVSFVLSILELGVEVFGVPGEAFGTLNAIFQFVTDMADNANGEALSAIASKVDQLGEDTANTFAAGLASLAQTFGYLYANWGKLSAVASGLTHDEPAWDITAGNAAQYVTAASGAIKLGYYRALIPLAYQRSEAQAAPTPDLHSWCLAWDQKIGKTTCAITAADYNYAYPSSAYTFPVQASALNFKPAHDNILIGVPRTDGTPLTPKLMSDMVDAGLYRPYAFLRWQLDGPTCPINIDTSGNPFGCTDETGPPKRTAPDRAPTITTTNLPAATVGRPYRATLTATGGPEGTYHWALGAGGRLPPGIALSSDGVLSGMPTTAGHYRFTVAVGDPATATFTLTVLPAPVAPRAATVPTQPAFSGGGLAATGVPTLPLLVLAALLLLAGIPLSLIGGRRARHRPGHPPVGNR